DILIAAEAARESNLGAVGREERQTLALQSRREPRRVTTVAVDDPDVSTKHEGDLRPADRRLLEQQRAVGRSPPPPCGGSQQARSEDRQRGKYHPAAHPAPSFLRPRDSLTQFGGRGLVSGTDFVVLNWYSPRTAAELGRCHADEALERLGEVALVHEA